MSRLLTREELEALLASGPIEPGPTERIRIGDPVTVVVDGITVAHGHLVFENGRLCVRVATLVTASDSQEKDR